MVLAKVLVTVTKLLPAQRWVGTVLETVYDLQTPGRPWSPITSGHLAREIRGGKKRGAGGQRHEGR